MFKRILAIALSLLMLSSAVFVMPVTALAASKPAKVVSLKTSVSCKKITLKWKKVKGADGYIVYSAARKNGKYKKVKTVSKNKASLKLKLGKTCYYKVRAYKKSGKNKVLGAYSAVKKATAAHSPSTSWTIEKKPTCAALGVKSNKCKYCKKKFTQSIEKDLTAHVYLAEYVPADDVNEGYNIYKCKYCGDSYNSKIKEHKYEQKITAPTCTEQGFTTYTCSKCGYILITDYTDIIPHNYEVKSFPANCTDDGYTLNVCTDCGYIDEESKTLTDPATGTDHIYEVTTVAPTCTEEGFTADVCTVCGYINEETKTDIVPALGHEYPEEYVTGEDNFRHYYCSRCGAEKTDYTCYINLADETVSNPKYAVFGKSSTNTGEVNDKLDVFSDENGAVDFEITGARENFTIDLNAASKIEVKLNGMSLTNNGRDCINVKNKAVSLDENGEVVTDGEGNPVQGEAPKVYISAKDGSENTLITNDLGGNIIDSDCPLELRGHGKLTMESYKSTAVDCKAKIVIKNLTLSIKSANRGIDTKQTTQVEGIGGVMVTQESYYNIDIEANATITVISADDCIRCKNMTVTALTEGQTATIMNLNSTGGDGIQLEGNKGFNALSGNVTITAKKYAFNCTEDLIVISPDATVNANGTAGYSKPTA